jgi:exosortase
MGQLIRRHGGSLACGLAFCAVYAGVFASLVSDWLVDDNYSHGFLVLPAAIYLTWTRREKLKQLPLRPSWAGLGIVGAGLGILLIGTAGIEFFVTRVSMVVVLGGAVVWLFGWGHLRALAFPIAFLLLMIPLPALVFNQIAFPLQLLASQLGVGVLRVADVPVLREGNLIVLASTTLEVAEACSGIRSLVSLLTLALLYGVWTDQRAGVRLILALSAIPVAVVANSARVAGTGLAAHYVSAEVATGPLHEFFGWFVFLFSLALVVSIERVLRIFVPPPVVSMKWQETEA